MNKVPTLGDCRQMWSEIDFAPNTAAYPKVAEFVEALAKVYSNGKVLHRSFQIPNHETFAWYASRNKFYEMDFFEHFWLAPSVRAAIPQKLKPANFNCREIFEWSSPFMLAGYLAWPLASGGAYERHKNGANDAKRIADAAADELISSNYDSALLFVSHKAFSDFFFDVAWDNCLLLIHPSQHLVHCILATDTD